MILGRIKGRITTTHFSFHVTGDPKKFEYVQIMHHDDDVGYVLSQIVDLIRTGEEVIAKCTILGYRAENGAIKSLREPFESGIEVLRAQDDFIQTVVKLEASDAGALVGNLEGRDIPIHLDLQTLLTKHLAVLAKSGAGKSYCVGVLIEEIIQKKVPLIVIDPHGEYDTLQEPTTSESDKIGLQKFGLKPHGFGKNVQVYGNTKLLGSNVKPLKLSDKFTSEELGLMLPTKLSATQEGLLYSVMQNSKTMDFDELLFALEQEESPAKWNLMKVIRSLKDQDIFGKHSIAFNELLQSGKCSVLNLKGIVPQVQEIFTYKLLKDLFELRKLEKIPPFFCVIEEAHNFCPERSFGQAASSGILRTIASEGRKFGMGLAIISQRPARVDKSVLSQVSTQIILKVTNPNDLKAISNSVEGLTSESEDEIQNLSIGHGLITGVVDVPLFVQIRPRFTKHGGTSVDMLANAQNDKQFFEKLDEFEDKELLPILQSNVSKKDIALMADEGSKIKTALIPCVLYICESNGEKFSLLLERMNGGIITDLFTCVSSKLPEFDNLTQHELTTLQQAFSLKEFVVEQYIAKFGGGFEVKNVLDSLVKKKYLKRSQSQYSIDTTYLLVDPKTVATHAKIEFISTEFDIKLEPRLSFDELEVNLRKFVQVTDKRECYIVKYETI